MKKTNGGLRAMVFESVRASGDGGGKYYTTHLYGVEGQPGVYRRVGAGGESSRRSEAVDAFWEGKLICLVPAVEVMAELRESGWDGKVYAVPQERTLFDGPEGPSPATVPTPDASEITPVTTLPLPHEAKAKDMAPTPEEDTHPLDLAAQCDPEALGLGVTVEAPGVPQEADGGEKPTGTLFDEPKPQKGRKRGKKTTHLDEKF